MKVFQSGMHMRDLVLRSVLIISVLLVCGPGMASDGPHLTPRLLHSERDNLAVAPEVEVARLIVKFHDGSGISADRGRLVLDSDARQDQRLASRGLSRAQTLADAWDAASLLDHRELRVSPVIGEHSARMADKRLTTEQRIGRELPDMATYVAAENLSRLSRPELEELVEDFNRLASVEIAYLEPVAIPAGLGDIIPRPPPTYSCSNLRVPRLLGDLTGFQEYHGPPPAGIGVAEARLYPGGYGEGVRVIDIEGGFFKHADLPNLFQVIGHNYTTPPAAFGYHGTATLGVLGAQDNGWGMTGIVPEASIGFRGIVNNNLHSDWDDAMSDPNNVAHHIYWAGMHSIDGVVLLELQRTGPEEANCACSSNCSLAPVEFWPADFDAIVSAVANGATVVEAAGNGGRSLDHPVFDGAFDQDSGAIMVSGSLDDGVTPSCPGNGQAPNFGSRIDVHSWSENVATTGKPGFGGMILFDGDGVCFDYTHSYGGTSAASAIVAGVATLLNAVYREAHGEAPDPEILRQIISDTGSLPLPGPVVDQWIGTHPDLGAATEAILDL